MKKRSEHWTTETSPATIITNSNTTYAKTSSPSNPRISAIKSPTMKKPREISSNLRKSKKRVEIGLLNCFKKNLEILEREKKKCLVNTRVDAIVCVFHSIYILFFFLQKKWSYKLDDDRDDGVVIVELELKLVDDINVVASSKKPLQNSIRLLRYEPRRTNLLSASC